MEKETKKLIEYLGGIAKKVARKGVKGVKRTAVSLIPGRTTIQHYRAMNDFFESNYLENQTKDSEYKLSLPEKIQKGYLKAIGGVLAPMGVELSTTAVPLVTSINGIAENNPAMFYSGLGLFLGLKAIVGNINESERERWKEKRSKLESLMEE